MILQKKHLILITFLGLSILLCPIHNTVAEEIIKYDNTVEKDSFFIITIEDYGGYNLEIEFRSENDCAIWFLDEIQYARGLVEAICIWNYYNVDFIYKKYHINDDLTYYIIITTNLDSVDFQLEIKYEKPEIFTFSNYMILALPILAWLYYQKKDLTHLSLKTLVKSRKHSSFSEVPHNQNTHNDEHTPPE